MDLKQYRSKLIGSDKERAVSPVIGVILMVAITVILAAVIAAFVLDMGQGQSANAQAGIEFNNNSDKTVDVTVTSAGNADELRLEADGNCDSFTGDFSGGTNSDPSAGDSGQIECDSPGTDDTVRVIGVVDGSENVITTYENGDG